MSDVAEVLRGMNGVLVKSPTSIRMAVLMVVVLMMARVAYALGRRRDRSKDSQRVGAQVEA